MSPSIYVNYSGLPSAEWGIVGFKESQYDYMLQREQEEGRHSLGLVASAVLSDDPRRLAFLFSRYKFVSKMFDGLNSVLEVGCGDATGTPLVRQVVPRVVATDFDEVFINDATHRNLSSRPIEFTVHDFLEDPMPEFFDGAFALDVLEHIDPQDEDQFLANICLSLHDDGVAIFGMPSLESQPYASAASKAGHVNCKTGVDFANTLRDHFRHVFLFSMNDEVVHTGFSPMAHYLLCLCVQPLRRGASQ